MRLPIQPHGQDVLHFQTTVCLTNEFTRKVQSLLLLLNDFASESHKTFVRPKSGS